MPNNLYIQSSVVIGLSIFIAGIQKHSHKSFILCITISNYNKFFELCNPEITELKSV